MTTPVENLEALQQISNKFKEFSAALAVENKTEQQLEILKNIKNFVATEDGFSMEDLMESSIIPKLLQFIMQQENTSFHYEIAVIFTHLTLGTVVQTKMVLAAGVLAGTIKLLTSTSPKVHEQAVKVLCNIVADGNELCSSVIEEGVLKPLFALITAQAKISLKRNIACIISTICRNKPTIETIQELLAAIKMLINSTDNQILVETLFAVKYLTDEDNKQIQLVLNSGIAKKLISFLGHAEIKVQLIALRAVGNILTGTEDQIQVMLYHNVLSHMPTLLSHNNLMIRKGALWCISSINAGNHAQIDCVINAGLLPKLTENLTHSEFDIQKEATWAMFCLTGKGNRDQVFTLIQEGVILPMCDIVSCNDLEVVNIVLQSFQYMLDISGGLIKKVGNLIKTSNGYDNIKLLMYHEHSLIKKLARDIVNQIDNL